MEIQLGYFPQVILLVFARVAAVILTVPFYGGPRISVRIRMVMAFMIAMVMISVVPSEWTDAARQINTLDRMLFAMLSEILLGAGVGLICHAFVAAFLVAGTLAGRGSSLMMAKSIDPVSGTSNVIIGQILQTVFVLLVLLCNGHLVLLKLVAMSFRSSPQPMAWMGEDFFRTVMCLGSTMFEWGLKFALPVMCASLILNVCLGLIARMAPDFNILFLSLPIRLFVGISVLGLVLRLSAGFFERAIDQMLKVCAGILM